MADFVQLKASQGETIYGVSRERVTFIQSTEEPEACIIRFVGGDHITVAATFADLSERFSAG